MQVRAENTNGESPWSSSTSDTPSGKPAKPDDPTLSPKDGELEVEWTAPSDNGSAITGYKVQYKEQNSDNSWPTNWTEHTHSETTTTTTISGLTNGMKYRVEVAASNSNGDSPWSDHAEGSPAQPPDAPDGVTIESYNGSLKVIWSTPASNGTTITGYQVRYCDNSDEANKDCYSNYNNWITVNSTGTGTTKTITGLTNGREYIIEVRTLSSNGSTSVWSSQATAKPGAPSAPGAPRLQVGGQIGTGKDQGLVVGLHPLL